MKRYFITGTDTDCGKTYASVELLKYLRSKSHTVAALKPVASGCRVEGTTLVSSDAQLLSAYSELSIETINPWRYELPVSPNIASSFVGEDLSIDEIAAYCMHERWNCFEYLIIEGAGGISVPLTETETWLDMLKICKIPVIFIVGIRLGCINHAILTEFALLQHNLQCTGWIANFLSESRELQHCDQVINTLRINLNTPCLGIIPYDETFKPSEAMINLCNSG